jgi:hypothetical protein
MYIGNALPRLERLTAASKCTNADRHGVLKKEGPTVEERTVLQNSP